MHLGTERDLTLSAAPAVDFLTDGTVWDHLRVETSGSPAAPADQALIGGFRDAAQEHLDGFTGILGRALITQTWVMKLARFPCGGSWSLSDFGYRMAAIEVPLPPLQSITSIVYLDRAGASQTLSASRYQVVSRGKKPSLIVPAYGEVWPVTRDQPQAVTVTFVAGYGAAAEDVPAPIRSAGLLMVSDLYQNREAQSAGYEIKPNPAVDRLIAPYRVLHA